MSLTANQVPPHKPRPTSGLNSSPSRSHGGFCLVSAFCCPSGGSGVLFCSLVSSAMMVPFRPSCGHKKTGI